MNIWLYLIVVIIIWFNFCMGGLEISVVVGFEDWFGLGDLFFDDVVEVVVAKHHHHFNPLLRRTRTLLFMCNNLIFFLIEYFNHLKLKEYWFVKTSLKVDVDLLAVSFGTVFECVLCHFRFVFEISIEWDCQCHKFGFKGFWFLDIHQKWLNSILNCNLTHLYIYFCKWNATNMFWDRLVIQTKGWEWEPFVISLLTSQNQIMYFHFEPVNFPFLLKNKLRWVIYSLPWISNQLLCLITNIILSILFPHSELVVLRINIIIHLRSLRAQVFLWGFIIWNHLWLIVLSRVWRLEMKTLKFLWWFQFVIAFE